MKFSCVTTMMMTVAVMATQSQLANGKNLRETVASKDATNAAINNDATNDKEDEQDHGRRLGGRKNCSHSFSESAWYKICAQNGDGCLQYNGDTSDYTINEAAYSSSDDTFKWQFTHTSKTGSDMVHIVNKDYTSQQIKAKYFNGNNDNFNDNKFRITHSSSCSDTTKAMKINIKSGNNFWLKDDGQSTWYWRVNKSNQGKKYYITQV